MSLRLGIYDFFPSPHPNSGLPEFGTIEQRWSRFTGQNGGLAKVDSGFDYAANFSSFACV